MSRSWAVPADLVTAGEWDGEAAVFGDGPDGRAARDVWRIAQRVRKWRQRKGLTQVELAQAAGVAWRSVHQLEHGTAWPSTRTVAAVAAVLGARLGVFRLKADF